MPFVLNAVHCNLVTLCVIASEGRARLETANTVLNCCRDRREKFRKKFPIIWQPFHTRRDV